MSKKAPYDSLFQEYLRICNEALQCSKHCYPYDRIVLQIEDHLKDRAVQVAIYDQNENHPEAFYDMVLKDQLLTAKVPHKPRAKNPWQISRYFLEQVTNNPYTYISNPAQLDWKWLTDHDVGL